MYHVHKPDRRLASYMEKTPDPLLEVLPAELADPTKTDGNVMYVGEHETFL